MHMKNQKKRVTIVISPEVEKELKEMKRELFYECNQSYMIRELIEAGFRSITCENHQEINKETNDIVKGISY